MNDTDTAAPGGLHEQELRVLALLASGVTTDIAARRLGISDRTLRRRVTSVCECFGVETRIEAITEAARRGLI